jgi:hypothetical protein
MKHYRTTLKKSLLATALGTCASLPVTAAAAAEDFATPNRAASTATAQTLIQMPGQKLSMKISETLTIEKISQVLSDDEMSSIDINWEALSNPQLPFDHPDIRSSLVRLKRVLTRLLPSKVTNAKFMEVWTQFSVIDASISSVHWDRVKELTPQFFQTLSCEVIDFAPKYDGVQFGAKATVKLPNGQTVKYHIKTHSGGLASGKSSAAKLVNPSELLVYKVLEGLGVGPQSHFFGRDGQNLYIATLDAGMQPSADAKTLTPVPFKEYEYFKNDQQAPSVQAQLWGALSQLPTDVDFSDAQHQRAEVLVNAEEGIARNFVHEVAKLDVIARIMRLTDFQTNPGNYGFVPGSDGRLKAKAIDFRLNSKDPNEIRFGEHFFKGFLDGNGYYDYSSTGKAMYYALRKRQRHLRVQEAQIIMERELKEFETIVDRASMFVSETLSTQIPMTPDDQTSRQRELAQYADIIKSNFRLFRDQLQQWRPSAE